MDMADCDPEVRVIVLTGGDCRIFTAGLDLQEAVMQSGGLASSSDSESQDFGRKSLKMHDHILLPQEGVSAVEKCKKPVIVALHNGKLCFDIRNHS